MSDLLGLSIGTTNLVAACPGRQPVTRRSVLTLWDNRPPEVGVPSQNPELTSPNLTQGSLVLRGFVERVGDPVPLVAADGSTHRGEALVVMALTALARAVDDGIPPTTVVVTAPAHWGPAAIGSLRGALRESPLLSPGGLPPTIVSDATAALAALQADPGLPGSGVVALCDFGAGGTSITLADAGANLAPIGETVRFGDFSGDQIDRALLDHVLAGIRAAGGEDTAGTAAFGALTRLREECRLAKERLSFETTTALAADLPGFRSDIMVTRAELNAVIADPLTGFLDALGDALERNRIPATSLTAIGVVGGGSVIPAVSQRLSDSLQVPVIASPWPNAAAAVGAVMLAARGTTYQDAGAAPTGLSTTPADAPTGLAPAAWAAGAAGQAANESASDGSPSATFRALAWSQDDDAGGEPVPYSGADYTGADYTAAPQTGSYPMAELEPDDEATVLVDRPLPPWYRRPPLLFGLAAAAAALAVGGLAITLTASESTPTTTTTRVTKPGEDPATSNPAVPQTITVTGGNGQTTVTTVTPPPTSATTSAPTTTTTPTTTTPTTTTTTTTTTPTTTTTTTTPTTTTTTTTPTTTRTTTTTTTEPPTTTTQPPTTTTAPPTTTTTVAPPTTTVAPAPTTTVEPVVTTQAVVPEEPLPTTKPAPAQ